MFNVLAKLTVAILVRLIIYIVDILSILETIGA
jgi:hypothetical protein